MHLIAVHIDQFEPLQDHADRQRRLVHCKAAADASALAVAEGLPCVDRTRRFGFAAEVFGIERIRVRTPDAGIAVQRHDEHGNEGILLQFVFAADGLVLQRRDAKGRRRRP